MIKRGLRPFRRLQWKLTCSYALISMLAWLAVVILVLGAIWWGMNINKASILSISLQNEAKKAAPLVKRPGGVDQAGLESWLQKERNIESSLLAYKGSF